MPSSAPGQLTMGSTLVSAKETHKHQRPLVSVMTLFSSEGKLYAVTEEKLEDKDTQKKKKIHK